jgi:oxygen-independent coproporphyrinogen-3 oxidase
LTGGAQEPPLGLYVHIPFCEARCSYCHFAIDPRRPDAAREGRYLRAVLAEMEAAEAGVADTLYLGGGTPSLVAAEGLGALVEASRRLFALPPHAEVTVAANPNDLRHAGFEALVALGVSRLSLGVQSLDDAVLRDMGRHHTAADSRRAVREARQAGLRNVNLDVILGWPGEARDHWRAGLEDLLSLEPDHVSLYLLEVEGRTVLSHRQARGTLSLPDEDLVADLYQETVDRLAEAGLERYEISNFARPGRESRHNGKYWDDAPFLGFGMAAHGYRGGCRYWNHDRFIGYCRAVEQEGGGGARTGERRLDPRERAAEALFTGLRRREGIDLRAFRGRYSLDPEAEWGEAIEEARRTGLLTRVGDRLCLSDRGVLLSNEVFQAFV